MKKNIYILKLLLYYPLHRHSISIEMSIMCFFLFFFGGGGGGLPSFDSIPIFTFTVSLPFPKRQILDCSKLTEFADDDFNFDENGRKFSEWVENTVGKGEMAR